MGLIEVVGGFPSSVWNTEYGIFQVDENNGGAWATYDLGSQY